MSASVYCSDLTFAWPDGTVVLDGLNLALGPGRAGLIGVNGSGKSTLLRLLAGELRPTKGAVAVSGTLGYLPQHLPLDARRRIDDMLGIADVRRALHAVEAGQVTDGHLTTIGDDWDSEERAHATLDRLGLTTVDLDRTVGTVSGGESVLLGLAALLLRRPEALLLDEPTNNLDVRARKRLYDAVAAYRGVLIVVSHDRRLLDRMDQILDLREHTIQVYGGNLTAYEQAVAREQAAAQRMVRVAQADVRRQRRELTEARVKLDRRQKIARKAEAEKRVPKIIAHERKREAQVSAGKLRDLHSERLATAEGDLATALEGLRTDEQIRIDLPETHVPTRRTVLVLDGVNVAPPLWSRSIDLALRGPERVALIGANGAGKTTLLRLVTGDLAPATGTVQVGVAGVRYLPQRLNVLDDTRSVLDNARQYARSATVNQVRARLARFDFRGERAAQPAGTLSGGERFRAVLAALLSAQPPPQLLLLDEPTNNLDMASAGQLEQALGAYRGALLVASHDVPFLRALGITRWLHLSRTSGLEEGEGL